MEEELSAELLDRAGRDQAVRMSRAARARDGGVGDGGGAG